MTMASTENSDTTKGNPTRRKALLAVGALVLLGGIGYGAYWWLVLNHFESTDNAYVQGNVVQLTPQVGGTVIAINADDTDHVKAGQLLVKLDPADAQVALEQAEAQLAET
ncbi:MAG: biotin/lipoyl-binding protein, partial [Betaproteobacteria bacterium]